jgi:APA family basic amino acid/polyamine antiporter
MGILISGLMMVSLPFDTWLRLIIWLIIGMALYFFYGRHHSRVQIALANPPKMPPRVMAD